MASGTIKTNCEWTSVSIGSNSYGSAFGYYNEAIKLAVVGWYGNSTAPTAGQYSFTLPSKFIPPHNFAGPVRSGDSIEARADGNLNIRLTTSTYSSAILTYPMK